MTNYDFGDVVLVPFPFTDQSTTKKRPAIVVSSADYNSQRPDLILVAVTYRKDNKCGPLKKIPEILHWYHVQSSLLAPRLCDGSSDVGWFYASLHSLFSCFDNQAVEFLH